MLITHCDWTADERLRYGFPFWIDMAVPLFLIISGYVNTLSFRKKGIETLSVCYAPAIIAGKVIRYTVPFGIAYTLEIIFCQLFNHRAMPSAVELLREFLSGGMGPGSYYYPILIQMILVFPIIYSVVRQNGVKGLAICAFGNFLYELMQWAYGLSENTYRLLIFRYILLLAFGCYFGLGYKLSKTTLAILSGIAVSYIVLVSYCNITVFFIPYWKGTSFIPALLAVCIFALVYTGNIRNRVLETIGKASYHIFLTQKVYYVFEYVVHARVPVRWMQFVANVVICLIFGLMFYLVEAPISKLIMKQFSKWTQMHTVPKSVNR